MRMKVLYIKISEMHLISTEREIYIFEYTED